MGVEDIRDSLVVRERSTFLLTDLDGNVPTGNDQGLGVYHGDTRHLSAYSLTVNGMRPVMLLSTAELGYAMEQVMTNPSFTQEEGRAVKRGTVSMRRKRVIGLAIEETLDLTNHNRFAVTLHVLYELGADFADIFDVRGYAREHHGAMHPPDVGPRSIAWRYDGVDGRQRSTTVRFGREPDFHDGATALFRVTLPARESARLRLQIAIDGVGSGDAPIEGFQAAIAADYRRWEQTSTQVVTDNEFFNRVIQRALHDVRMLWSETNAGEPYPAAGTPWFDAPFGRDSCIMAMQLMGYRPDLARHCLRLLARWQGKRLEPGRDEEPGKIFHELRFDELSNSGELPYSPYYGSIDSTPLFLLLAATYYEWTADHDLIRVLMPSIRAALGWLDANAGERPGGYLSYEKRSTKGLINQGWKDSFDAVPHPDGTLASAPIALAEAQGYAYAARLRLAPALERIGERDLAARLRMDAEATYRSFNDDFWVEGEQFFALALDGEGHAVESVTSNPGHCMWTGIIGPGKAAATVRRLMLPDVFSGWGLRTLSAHHPRFNPLGYHAGTVWPHDNSIAAMGFKMYGYETDLDRLATALFDAAVSFDYFRLPELFCGDERTEHAPPVPYPVACRPQSWAAGAFPLITQALLGLKAEAPEGRLRIVNPRLPAWLNTVVVRHLRVGDGTVTLRYDRRGDDTRVAVEECTDGLDVIISRYWPR
jgi:glycogen debranching enzyme